MDWYYFALVSLAFYSLQGLLLKYIAVKNCDKDLTTLCYMLTVTVITIPLLLFFGISTVTMIGLAAAVINGVFYSFEISMRIEALKYIAASIAFPIVRTSNAFVAVLFVLVLGEKITILNSIGIILSISSIYLLVQGEKK
jgi:uncharacterized membrane protein